MPISDQFDQWTDREQREFAANAFNYFAGAQQRHQDILDRLDVLLGALGAGLRAAGEALQQGSRRR